MNVFKDELTPIALFCFLAIQTNAQTPVDDPRLFTFKFPTNQTLVYAVSEKTKTATDNNIAGKASFSSNTKDIRYKVGLTGYRKNADGTVSVHFKPYDIEEDLDFNNGPNHVVTQIRGLKIKSLQNSIVTIDTENDVGLAQASSIKTSVYPTMLSGYFDLDPIGNIQKFEGDLPFVDYWTNVLKTHIGFFSIVFPIHPVGIREAWTENLVMNSSGGLALDKPLTITNTFTRGLDQMTNGNSVATIDMTSSDHLRNLSGYIQQNGQKTSLDISQFDHNAFGTFHFDQRRGVLLDAKTTDTGDVSIEMLVQGNSATSHITIETETQINLLVEPQQN